MHQSSRLLFLVLVLTACAPRRDPTVPSVAKPAPRTPASSAHARAVEQVAGVWRGLGDTPFGEIPIALAFEREADSSIHARLRGPGGMYLDFRFRRAGERWLLLEEGYLPGQGTQTHELVPVGDSGPARWVDRVDANVLAVTIEVDASTLVFTTLLHGEPHAAFRLKRVTGNEAEGVRRAIASAGVSSP